MTRNDVFAKINDGLLIKIIFGLDLKDWGHLACVYKTICSVLYDFCYKIKCTQKNHILVSDILSNAVCSYFPSRCFKKTMIWRVLNDDGNEYKVDLNCAFCSCKHTWDLYSPLCSKQVLGFQYDDGEPFHRAFVCEN